MSEGQCAFALVVWLSFFWSLSVLGTCLVSVHIVVSFISYPLFVADALTTKCTALQSLRSETMTSRCRCGKRRRRRFSYRNSESGLLAFHLVPQTPTSFYFFVLSMPTLYLQVAHCAPLLFALRYWKNVSADAKNFIRQLFTPDPVKWPNVREAMEDPVRFPLSFYPALPLRIPPPSHLSLTRIFILTQWLTTSDPSVDHDLSGPLREHFSPRAKWRQGIARARIGGMLAHGH